MIFIGPFRMVVVWWVGPVRVLCGVYGSCRGQSEGARVYIWGEVKELKGRHRGCGRLRGPAPTAGGSWLH